MKIDTWKIIPTGLSGFHLGRHGMDEERSSGIFSSDSLFSAFCSVFVMAEGEKAFKEFIQPMLGQAPLFSLSSAFPYAGDIRFFPTPQNAFHLRQAEAEEQPRVKDLKKIEYLSQGTLKQFLQGDRSLVNLVKNGSRLPGGFLVLKDELSSMPNQVANGETPVFETGETSRALIDRVTNQSNLFFTGKVRFAQDCGLWFGVQWKDASVFVQEKVAQIISYLSEQGIGGSRSSGYGQVDILSSGSLTYPDTVGHKWLLLSRYIPRESEMAMFHHPESFYNLEEVGGWLQSPGNAAERRKTVVMVKEGSVFGPMDAPPQGQVVDVQPVYEDGHKPIGHPVYRSGLAFGVGFSEGGSNGNL